MNTTVKFSGPGLHLGHRQGHYPEEEGQRFLGQLEDRQPQRGRLLGASLKMTSKGTYYFRTKFAATTTQIGGTSVQVKVVVK